MSCEFDKKWTKRVNGNTWNSKDSLGILMIILFLTIITFFIYLFITKNKKIPLIIFIIALTTLISIIFIQPVAIMYPTSAIISSRIRTPEFIDRNEYFPNSRFFEKPQTFKTIQQELEFFMKKTDNGHNLIPTANTYGKTNENIGSGGSDDNKWRLFQIKILGNILPGAKQHFPTVVDLCNKFPEILSCVVSVLEPNVIIPSHVGYMKGIIRYMLPLKIPKDRNKCFLCVNNIKYNWEEGVGVAWDDTYPHMVKNLTDETRVVIYFDIVRKGMNKLENALLNMVTAIVKKSPIIRTQMSQQEKQIKQFKN